MSVISPTLKQLSPNDLERCYVPSYHFDLLQSCFCQSGKLFGNCCGDPSSNREPPKNISIINNFISKSECNRFLKHAKKQKRAWLSVIDPNKTTANKTVHKRDTSRITQRVMLGKKQIQANEWFGKACTQKISALAKTEWFESPHLLRYGPGGKYSIHSDSEQFDSVSNRFYRFIDRDFSMLIYLNDDYKGGELNFPWLNYRYKPVAGDLVFFPSNHVFSHESMPITYGEKFALVSWGACAGTARTTKPRSMIRI